MEVNSEPTVRIDCKQHLVRAVRYNGKIWQRSSNLKETCFELLQKQRIAITLNYFIFIIQQCRNFISPLADGQYAMTCGSDRTIKLWRPSKLLELKCYKGHSADVIDCQANKDSSQFLSCSNDKSVILWDVENGKILRRFRNLAPFNTICYGHEATTAFASSADGTVRIYDLRTLNAYDPIQSLTEASDNVTCCKVNKHLVFTTSLDKGLRTYDIRQGKLAIDTLHMPLNCVSVSQDAATILVSCLRGPLLLIDRIEGKILNEYGGHENKLFRIESTLTLKDSHVVAGSEDGQVYVWDSLNKQPKLAFKHANVSPPIIQSLSSDSMDSLLTACGSQIFMWALQMK